MRFTHPQGLWMLLFIPILIVFYLWRSKFDSRLLSSTFLWKLNEAYRQKHKNTSRLRKLIQLLLQISLFVVLALTVSGLTLTGRDTGREFIALLDTSASMRMRAGENGETLFSLAKEQLLI